MTRWELLAEVLRRMTPGDEVVARRSLFVRGAEVCRWNNANCPVWNRSVQI